MYRDISFAKGLLLQQQLYVLRYQTMSTNAHEQRDPKDSTLLQFYFFDPCETSPNMLQTVALSGSRGQRQLFSDVSVTVKPGTLLAVAGANGSGKTSFLRILCGLLSPDGGTILWQGKDIHQLKELYPCPTHVYRASQWDQRRADSD